MFTLSDDFKKLIAVVGKLILVAVVGLGHALLTTYVVLWGFSRAMAGTNYPSLDVVVAAIFYILAFPTYYITYYVFGLEDYIFDWPMILNGLLWGLAFVYAYYKIGPGRRR